MSTATVPTIQQNLQPGNSILNLKLVSNIVTKIQSEFKDIGSLIDQKFNIDFIKLVCDEVEKVFIDAKTMKVNKKDVVFQILTKLFGALPPADQKVIDGIIEAIHSAGLIVQNIEKKVPFIKKLVKQIIGTRVKLHIPDVPSTIVVANTPN